jgi:hypothetical protein
MYLSLDLTTVPPAVTLHDADNFKDFKIVANRPEHGYVGVDALKELAGPRASDPEWQRNLDGMLKFAEKSGWVREDGTVRAHVEWRD